MVNTYYTRNKYFDEVIRDYLENIHPDKWVKVDEPSESTTLVDMDFPHFEDGLMPTCKIMSQIEGLECTLNHKWNMYQLIKRCHPSSIGDYVPKTYLIKSLTTPSLRNMFSGRKYIVKPGERSGRCGIFVVNNYDSFCQSLQSERQKYPFDEWILQEYIDPPLLYEGKKFHFRVYALLIKKGSGNLQVYIYDKCMIHVSEKEYDSKNIDTASHISGGSCQSVMFPDDCSSVFDVESVETIQGQFNRIVKDTLSSAIPYLNNINNCVKGNRTYKLIAYDIVIDHNLKCYLAEINCKFIGFKKYPLQKMMYTDLLTTLFASNKHTGFCKLQIRNKKDCRKKTKKKEKKYMTCYKYGKAEN